MITDLQIVLDHEEYSKYDGAVAVVNASITATGGTNLDTLSWSIERMDGYGIVTGGTYPLSGPSAVISTDLRTLSDVDGINWANAGSYIFRVSDLVSGRQATASFIISIITVDEMKRKWIYGVSLESSDLIAPIIPPRFVTGVTFVDFSREHNVGPSDLVYVSGPPKTLSWAGGPPQMVFTGKQRLVLIGACNEYAVVDVDSTLLPLTDTSETIVIDRKKMTDTDLRGFIKQAVGWVEGYTHVAAEPRIAMSPTFWLQENKPFVDELTQPQSWYRPENTWQWLNFKVPVRRLLKVYEVEGFFQSVKSTVIPLGSWEVHDEYDGLLVFIPRTGSIINWETIQTTFMNFLFGRDFVPDFWHYRIAHGLRSLDIESNISFREAIAKKAAIDILLQAGSAQKAGISSESVARDGVSQSVSYTQSAMYGIYSHITIPYQEWLDKNMLWIKRRIAGLEFVTL